ncbi:biotin--[acetyl-CoA-carboxylase] ligase [Tanticharoenia sakaeratensis]|uniref:biotin--[biotin carboxyl-carrier protein] ligase n=1 Tax=Tanticharoenia sakaeratensis NBRC 103193 TaxID=1231623 RepID=A0A0D6MMY4_9PROT|nr:biotin--[acetyl-CoA-carboxylase] ligase [Tanticharoenia sakaeratensis]GAN55052.1 biotin operon repressor/biotin--[acetyl-CoA-carboxylase] synthetase [Tanticharoenia sakaeratensis NBRC 103193]GBQ20074.1 biotin--acetyl-CoA-carboxylase ligase [Tanticharoenia sakaeratensis NBRC 103193]
MNAAPDWRLERYDTLGSTSDLCRERAEAGSEAGLVIHALRQTSGRGTRGRTWIDPGGNLSMSVLLRPDPAHMRFLAFVVATAVFDALAGGSNAEDLRLSLKWPNDLMLAGRKLAGILIETGEEAAAPWAIVGIGVNLACAPTVPGRELACLADAGIVLSPPDAAARILACLTHWLEILERDGFAPVRVAWLAWAHPVGSKLAVQRGGDYIRGLFHGLDPNGALMLQTDSGEIVRSVAGEVLLVG